MATAALQKIFAGVADAQITAAPGGLVPVMQDAVTGQSVDKIGAKPGSMNTISATTRGYIPNGVGTLAALSEWMVARTWHRCNVIAHRPYLMLPNWWCDTSGATGANPEKATVQTGANKMRCAFIVGISGVAANQSTARVIKGKFFGMLKNAAFIAAGGSVSADGYTVTIPQSIPWVYMDPCAYKFSVGEAYYTQQEIQVPIGGAGTYQYPRVTVADPVFGDRYFISSNGQLGGADAVYKLDWTAATAANLRQGIFSPCAVFAEGNTRLAVIGGDSILSEVTSVSGTASAINDTGANTYGARNFLASSLALEGYSYTSCTISGARTGELYNNFGVNGIRAEIYSKADIIFNNLLTNDRTAPVVAMSSLLDFHCEWLRSLMKPGGRLVYVGMPPKCTSTDSFATDANQTISTAAGAFPAGAQWLIRDRLMRQGAYAGVPYGQYYDVDAFYDIAPLVSNMSTGKWIVNGSANYATPEGTHISDVVQATIVADLRANSSAKLKALVGF